MTKDFNNWWNNDLVPYYNPYNENTPPYWAWAGWVASAKAESRKVSAWMILHGYATGHGDTVEDLLKEMEWQSAERAIRARNPQNKAF